MSVGKTAGEPVDVGEPEIPAVVPDVGGDVLVGDVKQEPVGGDRARDFFMSGSVFVGELCVLLL